ncbi:hypothetical protein Tco_0037672 [Tanacetum coccineum]
MLFPLNMTRIYHPSGPDKEIVDYNTLLYGPKQSKPSESDARSSDFNSCESNCSEETHESMPELVVNEPKVVSEPKVWSDAPIIEEYESDSEDEHGNVGSQKSKSKDFSDIDIDTLTLEQYLALNRNDSQIGIQRPEIEMNAMFEIQSQLLKELHKNTFSRGKTEDAIEHLRKILEIASLFNTPGFFP